MVRLLCELVLYESVRIRKCKETSQTLAICILPDLREPFHKERKPESRRYCDLLPRRNFYTHRNRYKLVVVTDSNPQITQIEKTIGCSRFLYNRMLADKMFLPLSVYMSSFLKQLLTCDTSALTSLEALIFSDSTASMNITSATYLPHTCNPRFNGNSGSVMQLIFL